MMGMKHIRLRIIDLIDLHGDTFETCKGCEKCTEIKQLRKSLVREPAEKFKRILDKGQDMKKSDIAFLLERGVDKKQIAKAVGMTLNPFYKLLENYGFGKPKEEIKVGKLEMTAEEFVDLKYKQNLSFVQIAKLKGVSDPSVHNWKDRHKDDIEKALKASRLLHGEEVKAKLNYDSPEVKKHDTAPKNEPDIKHVQATIQIATAEEKNTPCNCLSKEEKAEYERLIAALRSDLNEAHKQLDEKDEQIRNWETAHVTYVGKAKEEQERLISLAQELERKLQVEEELRNGAIDSGNAIVERLKTLEEENNILRKLVKKWA